MKSETDKNILENNNQIQTRENNVYEHEPDPNLKNVFGGKKKKIRMKSETDKNMPEKHNLIWAMNGLVFISNLFFFPSLFKKRIYKICYFCDCLICIS